MSHLRVHELTKSFDDQIVLDRVSFEVEDGEFGILLGPSGCGKTTLLRIVAGLEAQDGGAVELDGKEVSGHTPRERDVAMVFQSYALYPHMSAFANMAFPLKARKVDPADIERRVREAARLLRIEALLDRKPKHLSGGQRQRVAMGRALVREPRLFLFDEPLSNLDASLRNEMRVELANLHRALGATILYVTHDQVEAMTLGQKVVLLDRGRIQQIGPPRELYDRPANLFVARFIGSPQMNLIDGTLVEDKGRLCFRSSELVLDLDAAPAGAGEPPRAAAGEPAPATGDAGPPRSLAGSEVVLGIRPEGLRPVNDGPDATGTIRGALELAEHIGSETLLHAKAGDARVVARVSPDWRGRPGETVRLHVDPTAVHLFADGRRIDIGSQRLRGLGPSGSMSGQ